jgi:hypothetical protein
VNQPQQRANGDSRMSDSDTNKPDTEPTDAPRIAKPAIDREDEKAGRTRRRRFRRSAPTTVEGLGAAETLASLRAELVLLREENASLKAAQHQVPDLGRVLKRARAVPGEHRDRDDVADEATQLLVEGLVLRESLLEVCQEIERSMIAVEAKLNALTPTPDASGRLAVGANGAGDHGRHPNGSMNGNGAGHEPGHPDIRLAPRPIDRDETDGHGPGFS